MKRNSVIGVTGQRGTGKSTWLRSRLAGESRLIVVDPLAEHGDWVQPISADIPEQLDYLAQLGSAFRVSLPIPIDEDEQQIAFEFYAKAAFQMGKKFGGITLAIDEVDFFCSPTQCNPGLNLLIQYGRHAGVDIAWVARNIGSVSRRLSSETDAHILFRVQEPLWLNHLSERFSDDIANEVAVLKKPVPIPGGVQVFYLVVSDGESWHETLRLKNGIAQVEKISEIEAAEAEEPIEHAGETEFETLESRSQGMGNSPEESESETPDEN